MNSQASHMLASTQRYMIYTEDLTKKSSRYASNRPVESSRKHGAATTSHLQPVVSDDAIRRRLQDGP